MEVDNGREMFNAIKKKSTTSVTLIISTVIAFKYKSFFKVRATYNFLTPQRFFGTVFLCIFARLVLYNVLSLFKKFV